jgi:uncharacterized phage protein gp47/JayE
MAYGLTPTGFVPKTFEVIQSELQAEFQTLFGSDIDLAEDSVAGQLINNQAIKLANLWALMQAIHSAMDPDKAEGVALDGVASLTNLSRLPAKASTVSAILYGTEGTPVLPPHYVKQPGVATEFGLATQVTISADRAADVVLEIPDDIVVGDVYSVTLNSAVYAHIAVSGNTKQVVLEEIRDLVNSAASYFTAVVANTQLRITTNNGILPFVVAWSETLDKVLLGSPAHYVATATGPLPVPENTLTEIVTPVSGLASVNNIVSGATGRDVELDDAFRRRRRWTLQNNAEGTDRALESRIRSEVVGVSYCRVKSNRTMDTDSDGRPPKSFEAVVAGGADADIAAKIWEVQPSGIASYGNTEVVVLDSAGDEQTVKFSRPVPKYIWVNMVLTLYPEELFPADGPEQIKAAVVAWAQDEYSNGVDVIHQRLFIPIFTVPGIRGIELELGATDDPLTPPVLYSADDIAMGYNEVALFASTRIVVGYL